MLIIPGRPSQTGLTWWVDAPAPLPAAQVFPSSGREVVRIHDLGQLRGSPGAGPHLVCVSGLDPATHYELRLGPSSGISRTLPPELTVGSLTKPPTVFTVALGSCFYGDKDPGAAGFYQPRVFNLEEVAIRFLCGDQLYMDLQGSVTFWTVLRQILLPKAPDPWAKYRGQWHRDRFGTFLTKSPNLMLADDHEFWNDFPNRKAWIPWGDPNPGSGIQQSLDRAYASYQVALNIDPEAGAAAGSFAELEGLLRDPARSFGFRVPPIEFFLLDTRSRRSTHDSRPARLCEDPHLQAAERWLKELKGPGVLVLSQPLVVREASWIERTAPIVKGDWSLPDYPNHFGRLCEALFAAPHDVIVLTGDIHWSRLYQLNLEPNGRQVYELVSSPLALITGHAPPSREKTETPKGNLEWRTPQGATRQARWVRRAVPPPEYATYATLRFTPRPAEVSVEIDFWGRLGGDATRPRPQLRVPPFSLH